MTGLSPPRPDVAGAVARGSRRARATAYARLAKLDVFDYYLAIPLAWTLLEPAQRFAPATLATLCLYAVGAVCVLAAGVALDDVTGYRDGSDATNYGPDAPARRLARKPLLTGALDVSDAVRFARLAAVAGTLAWCLAVLLAPSRPPWALLATAACLLMSLQYSYGLKLSYHGGQEIVLMAYGVGLVLGASGLAGGAAGLAGVQAVLFGLGPLLFGVYSNTNDVAGDGAVRRRTVAVLFPPRVNALFITALSAGQAAVVVVAVLTTAAWWWLLPVMAPALVVRGRQLWTGLRRGDILRARRLGITAHRLTVVALCLGNLAFATGGAG